MILYDTKGYYMILYDINMILNDIIILNDIKWH